jgi:hypothetical protein
VGTALKTLLAALLAAFALAAPAAAATGEPFSFGIDPVARGLANVAYATGPGGDRMLVAYSEGPGDIVARRIPRGAERADASYVVASRPGRRPVDYISLAYNARAREYLVAYYWWSSSNGSEEVLTQRIALDGTPRGEPTAVSHLAEGLEPREPELVYEPRSGGYLAIWGGTDPDGSLKRTIYSQRLDSRGRPTAERDTVLGEQSTFGRQVVRDATSGTYLLVHARAAGGVVGPRLVTRRLDSAGRPLARQRTVDLPSGTSAFRIAYGARARRFLLALDVRSGIQLRTLDRAGRKLGGAITIDSPRQAPDAFPTGLVYAPRSDRFLLTWVFADDRFHAGYFTYGRGQRISGDGRRLTGRRLVFAADGSAGHSIGGPGPIATYDARDDQHLVIWGDQQQGGQPQGSSGQELWGRRVDAR